jgi:hypothetical protein
LYNIGFDGKISTEKEFVPPTPTNPESPLACDFSEDLRVTNLSGGKIRVELPYQGYDIYEWTFSDGSKASGNPLIIDCNQKSSGTVTLDVWVLDPTVPTGKRRICRGTVAFFCNCGEKKEKKRTLEWPNAGGSGKKIKIEAIIWVKDGEIGCRSKHWGKNIFGIWVPLNLIFNTTGVFANITGSFKREVTPGICIIVNQPFNEKQLPPGNNATWQSIA